MSISAISGVSQASKQNDDVPPAVTSAPSVTPFSQQLDAQTAAKGHHHHHGGAAQSVTSSAATAASAAGIATPAGIAAALLHVT